MKRRLRHAAASYGSLLRNNPGHALAARHALRLFRQRAIYSFIPKNACSTMRLTLAVENGCIADEQDFNWIHQNNDTFAADLESLLTADYTFVILRCPFARLASAYLDKLVERDYQLWNLRMHDHYDFEPDNLTFREFVKKLEKPPLRRMDIHWRPQTDFLVYEDYDAYFPLEDFSQAKQELEVRLGITIMDARHLTRHGTDQYDLVRDVCFTDAAPPAIRSMKGTGQCPAPSAMYDDETISLVRRHYAGDLALYRSVFGESGILFP